MAKAHSALVGMAMAAWLSPSSSAAQPLDDPKQAPGVGVESPRPDIDPNRHDALREREVRIPYAPGDVVPEGFVVERGFNSGVFGAGMAIFGFAYVASVVLAATEVRLTESGTEGGQNGINDNLYAPILGPWSAIAHHDRPAGEVALLVVDGVLQAGGLTLIAVGLGTEKQWLVYVGSGVSLQTRF